MKAALALGARKACVMPLSVSLESRLKDTSLNVKTV